MPPTTAETQRACPLAPSQDGVCGCPAFWARSPTPEPAVHRAPPPPPMDEPSTPPGPPRETCFFWYHSTCRRGEQCHLAHETHATWPILAPRGFQHHEKCKLAKCPLRWDMVAIEGKGVEADVCSQETGALEGLIDPSSRAMNGEYGGSGSEDESGDEVGVCTLSLAHEKIDRLDVDATLRTFSSLPSTAPSTARNNSGLSNYKDPSDLSFAPNAPPSGPRTSNPPRPSAATQICFNWYHSQPCGGKCRYAHFISERGGEVSLPLGIRGHRGCALELCPLREDLRAPEAAKVKSKKAKVKKGKDAGGRSALERQRGARGETEQEILEMRRRVASERKERKRRRRMERRWEEMKLDYELSKSGGVGRWGVTSPQKVQPRVLVDYELPKGGERLEWDTDLVRRIFGEIE